MKITSNFDSGNIEVVKAEKSDDIRLKIRKDTNAEFFQWFHFRLQGVQDYPCKMNILNAGEASYPEGWEGYNACASYDRENWFRVPTHYDGKTLTINHTPERNSVYYAYFAPYSYEQHLNMIHHAQESQLCVLENIGETVQGRDLDMLIIGQPTDDKKVIWVVGRQHPGESMASWFMEGFVNRLLDEDEPIARRVLQKAVFYVVPNINPDGAILGNLRANAAGSNLNREWQNPDPEKSPEIYHVKNKMDETGVDLFLDIHGDEGLPYNFVSSIEGIPSFNEKLARNLKNFLAHWEQISPDFQTKEGYPKDEPGKANLKIGSKQIGERFRCLSVTLEMPFKDNNNLPDPVYGWSPERSIYLGESILHPISFVLDDL